MSMLLGNMVKMEEELVGTDMPSVISESIRYYSMLSMELLLFEKDFVKKYFIGQHIRGFLKAKDLIKGDQ